MEPQEIVFCKGGGCTAKLGPGILARVLNNLPKTYDPNLLIGFDGSDDAAVYKLTDDLAIVQTLDFFPPMVEDPYIFGQIAAANALSDIYAMGGDVKTALNIVCFPEAMDLNILGKIMLGGSEKVREAGGVLAGGHSIADSDVKYGLSVTGVIHPDKVFANSGCKVGDALILTKPLGVGIVCTASRMKAASKEAYDLAVKSMTTLNKYASEILRKYRLHGCTDVTGFGFLGHLCEMVTDQATARIYKEKVPYIPECEDYVEEFYLTAAAQRNRNHVQDKVEFKNCSFATEEILYDPQTSGGLLASVDKEDVPAIMEELEKLGLPCGVVGDIERLLQEGVHHVTKGIRLRKTLQGFRLCYGALTLHRVLPLHKALFLLGTRSLPRAIRDRTVDVFLPVNEILHQVRLVALIAPLLPHRDGFLEDVHLFPVLGFARNEWTIERVTRERLKPG